jgi:hypothetical protein
MIGGVSMTLDKVDRYIEQHLPGAAGQPDFRPSRNYNDAMLALQFYRIYRTEAGGETPMHQAIFHHDRWEFSLDLHQACHASVDLLSAIAWALYWQLERDRGDDGHAEC